MNAPDERMIAIMGRLTGLEMLVAGFMRQSKPSVRREAIRVATVLLDASEKKAKSDPTPVETPGGVESALAVFRAARDQIATFDALSKVP